jgi:hypothetical protein
MARFSHIYPIWRKKAEFAEKKSNPMGIGANARN